MIWGSFYMVEFHASVFQRIKGCLLGFIAIAPLVVGFYIILILAEVLGFFISDRMFLVLAGIFLVLYIFIFVMSIISSCQTFKITVQPNRITLDVSKKKHYSFLLDQITIGYEIKRSFLSFNGTLLVTEQNKEPLKIDCSHLGNRQFGELIDCLKVKDKVIKL